jgi:bifunctional DNA-binding transcriptional regulator/antitoxin component of YhaV-PrlF toxin-antitoxin module
MNGIDLEIEQRSRLGLPAEVLARANLRPGDRAVVQVRRDGRLVIAPLVELLDKYAGAIPGLSTTADRPEAGTE